MNEINIRLKLRYPEVYIEEHRQNRPVIWFVAKREGYNGMMQNIDIAEDSTDLLLMELLSNKQDSLSQKVLLKVYPNPFHNFLDVQSSINDNLVLTDIHGRVLLEKRITNGITRITTGNVANGIYMVNLVNQNIQFKLIKR